MRRMRDDAARPGPGAAEDEQDDETLHDPLDDLQVEVAELDDAPARAGSRAGSRARSQPRPHRAWRMVGVACALLAVLCIALNGPAPLLNLAAQTWQQLRAQIAPPPRVNALPAHLSASAWTAIRLPTQAAYVRNVTFVPAASTPLVAYACWTTRPDSPDGPAPLALYVTRDGGRSWSPLPTPAASATSCSVQVDVSQPQHILLQTDESTAESCATPHLFASDASGATWHAVTLPAPLDAACAPAFFLANGQLYAWSQDGHYAADEPSGSPLLVSGDGGATWASAFAGLGPGKLPWIIGAHGDGSLLLVVRAQGNADVGPPVAAALWCRDGASGRWSLLANAPDQSDAVIVANDAGSGVGCAFGPVYSFASLLNLDTGLPSVIAVEELHGRSWSGLPTLPIAGASGRLPLGGAGRVLGVGPAGTLLVDVPDTSFDLGGASPPHDIWAWDPTGGRWLRDYHSEPGNARIDGFSWDHSGKGAPTADLWLFSVNWGIPAFTGVFHSTFAATPLAPAGTDDG